MLACPRLMRWQAESADRLDIIFQYGGDRCLITNKSGTLEVKVGFEAAHDFHMSVWPCHKHRVAQVSVAGHHPPVHQSLHESSGMFVTSGCLWVQPYSLEDPVYDIFVSDCPLVDDKSLFFSREAKHAIFTSPRNDEPFLRLQPDLSAVFWYVTVPTSHKHGLTHSTAVCFCTRWQAVSLCCTLTCLWVPSGTLIALTWRSLG
jgi:hypothetical protein